MARKAGGKKSGGMRMPKAGNPFTAKAGKGAGGGKKAPPFGKAGKGGSKG